MKADPNSAAEIAFGACATEEQAAIAVGVSPEIIALSKLRMKREMISTQ
jgi:hypothetical protein